MPSSIFLLLTSFSFLLTSDLCSASPQNPSPTEPSIPTGPSRPGFDCTFQPVVGFGPDTMTPEYNAGLVSQDSVSKYIYCAGEDSKLQLNEYNQSPVNALDILVLATETCGQYKLSKVIQDYAKTGPSVKLTHYLCGKAGDMDLCALSRCIGAKKREHGLKGVCQNSDVNLFDNPEVCDTDNSDAGGDDSTTTTDNNTDYITDAFSPNTVADASDSTATATTSSSSDIATTTSPAQTLSNTAAASPSPSLNAASRMLTAGLGELTARGVLLIVLVAGL
ncbi:MAG: hypothetical protein Q9187_005156 [Circinaria calcarea]